jgi:hypothetical protein
MVKIKCYDHLLASQGCRTEIEIFSVDTHSLTDTHTLTGISSLEKMIWEGLQNHYISAITYS